MDGRGLSLRSRPLERFMESVGVHLWIRLQPQREPTGTHWDHVSLCRWGEGFLGEAGTMSEQQTESKASMCPACGEIFESQAALEKHQRDEHSRIPSR